MTTADRLRRLAEDLRNLARSAESPRSSGELRRIAVEYDLEAKRIDRDLGLSAKAR